MNRRIAVRTIVMHGDKLLCVRLRPYEGALAATTDKIWWCLPGGSLELGESLAHGIERETIEETGIPPHVGALLYIQQFATPDTEHLEFFFHVTNANDFLQIDLSKTTHGAAEIAEIAFVDPATTNVLPKFLTTEDIPAHIANGAPPKVFNFLEK